MVLHSTDYHPDLLVCSQGQNECYFMIYVGSSATVANRAQAHDCSQAVKKSVSLWILCGKFISAAQKELQKMWAVVCLFLSGLSHSVR